MYPPTPEVRKPRFSFFGTILVDLARSVAKGTIAGMCDRYSPVILEDFVRTNRDLVEAAFSSPDPRDLQTLLWLQERAKRYARYGPMLREEVTPEWVLSWLEKNYPAHVRVLRTPAGRRWFDGNFQRLLAYFFPA